jgi:uncharacterized protein
VILADVNVLIYAFRRDSERHAVCKHWLDNVVRSDAQFGLSPLALSGLARIVTLRDRASWAAALAIFRRMCVEAGARGPLVVDAWFAALAIEHGCAWISYDRDYARFPGLDWRRPEI